MSRLHQVSVRLAGGHNLMSIDAFLALEARERNDLIIERRVEFVDEEGKVMALRDALQQLIQRAPLPKTP
jgi:hypothetical protein